MRRRWTLTATGAHQTLRPAEPKVGPLEASRSTERVGVRENETGRRCASALRPAWSLYSAASRAFVARHGSLRACAWPGLAGATTWADISQDVRWAMSVNVVELEV